MTSLQASLILQNCNNFNWEFLCNILCVIIRSHKQKFLIN